LFTDCQLVLLYTIIHSQKAKEKKEKKRKTEERYPKTGISILPIVTVLCSGLGRRGGRQKAVLALMRLDPGQEVSSHRTGREETTRI